VGVAFPKKPTRFSGEIRFAAVGVRSMVAAAVPLKNIIIIPGPDYK
jgi:hypothetical protein